MLNFALIGAAGYIAPKHMKAIKETGNNLVVAFDPNDSVGIIDSMFPESEFFTDFESFLNYVNEIISSKKHHLDYISICSPNFLHFNHCSAAMRLGSNVICEKPLVPTPDMIDNLKKIEIKTTKKVFTILQLRHHQSIKNLRKKILSQKLLNKYEVELTYITSRGKWYSKSWKGDPNKSYGLATNIGIHFFDMLGYIFGKVIDNKIFLNKNNKSSGFIEYEKAKVKWFLSIDKNDLPQSLKSETRVFRSIKINNNELDFSEGFTDLHTTSYKSIIEGTGFDLNEVKNCTDIVNHIRNSNIDKAELSKMHPALKL